MKTLEKKYSKIERVVAKGKFSAWVYLRTVFLGAILGGLTAVIWIFKDKIEGLFTKTEPAQYLTDDVMRWVLLGVGVVVLFGLIVETIRLNSKELVLTPDKVVFREGVFSVRSVVIPLCEIKMVETKQNFFGRIVGVGSILIVSDAEQPYLVKNVKSPDRLSRRIMRQAADANEAARSGGRSRIEVCGICKVTKDESKESRFV